MNDQELAAEVRRVGDILRRRPGDLGKLAGWLLKEQADRRAAAAQDIDEALAGIERALELGETAWALEHVRLARGRLALDEHGDDQLPR